MPRKEGWNKKPGWKKGASDKGPAAGGFQTPLNLTRYSVRSMIEPIKGEIKLARQDYRGAKKLEGELSKTLASEMARLRRESEFLHGKQTGISKAGEEQGRRAIENSMSFLRDVFGGAPGVSELGEREIERASVAPSAELSSEAAGVGAEIKSRGQELAGELGRSALAQRAAGREFMEGQKTGLQDYIRAKRAEMQGIRREAPLLRQKFMESDFGRRMLEKEFGLEEQAAKGARSSAAWEKRQAEKGLELEKEESEWSKAFENKKLKSEIMALEKEERSRQHDIIREVLFGESPARNASEALKIMKIEGVSPELRRTAVRQFKKILEQRRKQSFAASSKLLLKNLGKLLSGDLW